MNDLFKGISAFALTPLQQGQVDEVHFTQLIKLITATQVDSIGVLGSTGNYAYLTRTERQRVIELAKLNADQHPIIVGVGATSTSEVLRLIEDAQTLGANGLLLAPMSYQKLFSDEVFDLYETVSKHISIPLCVYDNPNTTNFNFSDELHISISHLPYIGSIKLPGLPNIRERVQHLRSSIPKHVTLGISGDASAIDGLNAGCDIWYSVIGGIFPNLAYSITSLIQQGHQQKAMELSQQLTPIWDLFTRFGSLRVTASIAEILGLVGHASLPLPLKCLQGQEREYLQRILNQLQQAHII